MRIEVVRSDDVNIKRLLAHVTSGLPTTYYIFTDNNRMYTEDWAVIQEWYNREPAAVNPQLFAAIGNIGLGDYVYFEIAHKGEAKDPRLAEGK